MGKFLVGIFLVGILPFLVVRAELESPETLFDKWVKNIKPAILPRLAKDHLEAEHNPKPEPQKYSSRDLNILDVIRMVFHDHEKKLVPMLETFLKKTQDSLYLKHGLQQQYPMATEAPLTCQSSVQCTPAAEKVDLVGQLHELVDSLKNDADSCEPCINLFEGLQDLACGGPWEPERDELINLCQYLLFPLLNIDPIICNGTIDLQGQHLYCIAREATPREMCESVNSCYPPTVSKKVSLEERMPWVVKDKVQKKLRKKLARKEKKRARRQNGTIRVVQLADIHVQPTYALGAPADCKAFVCCLPNSIARDGSEPARMWGEYSCNLPERTMRRFLERVNDFNADFVVYTGDNAPHNMWEETFNSQLNCSDIVTKAMKELLTPGTKVYPNIGNHEMYPTNIYSMRLQDTVVMNQVFTAMWHGLAGLDAQANSTFADMSYYSLLHQPGLRILSINTNFDWYPLNWYNTLNRNDTASAEHKLYVENTLALARANGEKVIVLGHHPIGSNSNVIRNARWWNDLAVEYSDVIVLHVSGHTHIDELFLVIDPATDEAEGVNLVAAVTTSIANINPSMRVFELDSATFELLNYQSYFFEIDQQNPEVEPDMVLNYDARAEYNLTDLSPASWQDLVLRFIDDEELFQRWYNHRFADALRGPCLLNNICGETCKIEQICGIYFPEQDEADACISSWNITKAYPSIGQISVGYMLIPQWGIIMSISILFCLFSW